jgi:hypothetical protein
LLQGHHLGPANAASVAAGCVGVHKLALACGRISAEPFEALTSLTRLTRLELASASCFRADESLGLAQLMQAGHVRDLVLRVRLQMHLASITVYA